MMQSANPAGLKLTTTTRGSGKIYTLLEGQLDSFITHWEAAAKTTSGREVPSKIFITEDGLPVLVTPVLAESILVSVSAFISDGSLVAQTSGCIDARGAKLSSEFNTLTRNSMAEHIRNCDKEWRAQDAHIELMRVISMGTSQDVVHFSVTWTSIAHEDTHTAVDAKLLDLHGARIGNPAVVMGDCCYESQKYPGILCRRTVFSAHIPSTTPSFIINVRPHSQTLASNFHCIEGFVLAQEKAKWHPHAIPAEVDDYWYKRWWDYHRTPEHELEVQRAAQHKFPIRPKFSIVVPLFHTPIPFFKEMVASVLSQTYDNLELLLVNSTPEDRELTSEVGNVKGQDSRVHVVTLDCNYGITENANAGIAEATGEFIAFLDHDDVLERDILYWYVKGINDYPTTDLLYCDEDKFEDDTYFFPFYKPDWDPYFLETNNYVCHMLAVRTSVLQACDRPTSDVDGAQDHSLTLAVGEKARNVYHVRKVLYHWRVHEGSTAGSVEVKPESLNAGKIAVQRHLKRCGLPDRVEEVAGMPHFYRTYREFDEKPKVTVLLYGCHDKSAAQQEAQELQRLTSWPLQLVCCSSDHELAQQASGISSGYIVFLYAGVRPCSMQWIEGLVDVACRAHVGAVVPKVIYPDGSLQGLGVLTSWKGMLKQIGEYYPPDYRDPRGYCVLRHVVSAAHGPCLMVSTRVLREIGNIRSDAPSDLWDAELCLRASAHGYATVLEPSVEVKTPLSDDTFSENNEKAEVEWNKAKIWIRNLWPEAFSQFDRFYNQQVKQDGYRGID